MAQQNIDFGSFPDDPDADAIRTAFQKVQHNFTEVYAGVEGTAVASIIAGAGITASSPTGNVVVTSNIACVQVHTSTLSIGRDSNGSQDTTITQSSQTLWVDLPANIANVSNINLDGYVSAVGNITGGNVNTAGQVVATGNITGGNLITAGSLSSGNLSAANISTTGTLSVTSNANVGNIGANNAVFSNVSGNGAALTSITGANVSGAVAFATTANAVAGANVSGAVAFATTANAVAGANVSGAVSFATTANAVAGANVSGAVAFATTANSVAGANVSGTVATATNAGTVTTAAQPNITSVGTLSSLTISGNLASGNANLGNLVKANFFQGDGYLISNINVDGGTYINNQNSNVSIPIANGNITMSVNGTSNVVVVTTTTVSAPTFSGNFSGNVTTAAQGNITSLGTLTGLTVNGVSNLGNVGNVRITGGSANAYLYTDGAGNLTFGSIVNTPPGGANASIQFKDGGTYQGNTQFTFDNTGSGNLAVPGNIAAGNLVSANYVAGTLTTGVQTNITRVGTLANLTIGVGGFIIVNGTINAGNITGNVLTANYFVGDASNLTAIPGGNVSGAVGLATFAGTANAVAGANVSGTVANATYAVTAGTANSVAGANVSGTVANATYAVTAGTANAVAGANVSGTVASANNSSFLGGTAAANYLLVTGTGSSLTAITGANVTGTVANATYAVSAGTAGTAGTVTTNAQPNITSTGTLTNVTTSGFFFRSVGTGITAAGTTQGTATGLTKEINIVSTVASGAGVVLPTAVAGMVVNVTNTNGNTLLVYPASGAQINSLGTNAGFTQGTTTIQFIAPTTTQWYTVGATYA